MDFSWLLHGFVKIDARMSPYCYYGFVKVVLCIYHPLPNKIKLKFDHDFKLAEASALN